jgi:DNA-binding CsgD family transcriptional regulator/PAS domain-containing protein
MRCVSAWFVLTKWGQPDRTHSRTRIYRKSEALLTNLPDVARVDFAQTTCGVSPQHQPKHTSTGPGDPEQLAERCAAVLAVLPVGVLLLDERGSLLEANPAAFTVLGLSETARSLAPLTRRVTTPIGGSPVASSALPWPRALAGETVQDHDLAIAMPQHEAEWRLVTVSARPFYDPVSRATGALVIAFDRVQLLLRQTRVLDLPPYLQRVLSLLREGHGTGDIARELNITLGTTRLYIKRLYARLGVRNRSQLMLRAMHLGLDAAHT